MSINVAIIKDGVCENVAVFDNMKTAKEILQSSAVKCPEGYGIGDLYDGSWSKAPTIELNIDEKAETPLNILEEIAELQERLTYLMSVVETTQNEV